MLVEPAQAKLSRRSTSNRPGYYPIILLAIYATFSGMLDSIEIKAAELGIPDWRDTAAYPDVKRLWLSDWRWEFLRRNPTYRKAYFLSFVDGDHPKESEVRVYFGFYTGAGRGPAKQRKTGRVLTSDERRRFYIVRSFGLLTPVDPRLSAQDYVSKQEGRTSYFDQFRETQSLRANYAPSVVHISDLLTYFSFHDVFCRYDLSRDLEPQFKIIQDTVRAEQFNRLKKIIRPSRNNSSGRVKGVAGAT